jgi:hypothetical protein
MLHIKTPKDGYWLTEFSIKKVEELMDSQYMGYWCTQFPSGDGWNDSPVDVFYQPNPDASKGHSHYFGMFYRGKDLYITDAKSAFFKPISGVICEDGEVLVSRYRHDYVKKDDHMIDGGRDYLKCSLSPLAKVTVNGPNFIIEKVEVE